MKKIVKRVRVRRARAPVTRKQQTGIRLLKTDIVKKFGPAMLDLGDLSSPSEEMEAIAAVFDLSGFTRFCNRVDSYLAIPRFLNEFLNWFFGNIKNGLILESDENSTSLWAELPLMVKFLGDGLLVLWPARRMTEAQVCLIVATLYDICVAYRREFFPAVSLSVDKPPAVLRCGVARGKVFSLGDGKDYVGHCINNASRLSHLSSMSFCFPHSGFRVREHMPEEYARLFTPKYVSVRGVGEDEPVWVVKSELERLTQEDRANFRDAGQEFSALPDRVLF